MLREAAGAGKLQVEKPEASERGRGWMGVVFGCPAVVLA